MCFDRMLKMCNAKYNGEDWKRVELALGSWKKVMVAKRVISACAGSKPPGGVVGPFG